MSSAMEFSKSLKILETSKILEFDFIKKCTLCSENLRVYFYAVLVIGYFISFTSILPVS